MYVYLEGIKPQFPTIYFVSALARDAKLASLNTKYGVDTRGNNLSGFTPIANHY